MLPDGGNAERDMSRIQNKKTEVSYVIADSEQQQRRIDNFLGAILKGLPRTRIYQMLRRGEIRVGAWVGPASPASRWTHGTVL